MQRHPCLVLPGIQQIWDRGHSPVRGFILGREGFLLLGLPLSTEPHGPSAAWERAGPCPKGASAPQPRWFQAHICLKLVGLVEFAPVNSPTKAELM